MLSCGLLVAQQQPAKPITSLYDLEMGMPRDYVLASLASRYKLTEPVKPADPSKGADIWQLLSGDNYAGEVWFKDGKLARATVNLYYAEGDSANVRQLVNRLFAAFFDNSGQSSITEGPLGMVTRSRSATIRLESVEEINDAYNGKTLEFLMPQQVGDSRFVKRLFILHSSKGFDGTAFVSLDESILRERQGGTGQGKK
jgi:hypothetical protein